MVINSPNIFIVVGTPGSGKDLLIQAVNDMGTLHARIVPKHTTRKRQDDDGNEMICINDRNYNLENCDIIYENYNDKYGIDTELIWNGIRDRVFQVIVVSNIDAINQIVKIFGGLVKIVFVHSEMDENKCRNEQLHLGNDIKYINERVAKYRKAFNIFLNNYNLFDHVLIFSNSKENLFDQIFRLFNYYENL